MKGREEKPKKKVEIDRLVGTPDSVTVVKQEDSSRGYHWCQVLHGGQEKCQLLGLQKIKYRVTYDPVISVLGIHTQEN